MCLRHRGLPCALLTAPGAPLEQSKGVGRLRGRPRLLALLLLLRWWLRLPACRRRRLLLLLLLQQLHTGGIGRARAEHRQQNVTVKRRQPVHDAAHRRRQPL